MKKSCNDGDAADTKNLSDSATLQPAQSLQAEGINGRTTLGDPNQAKKLTILPSTQS